MARILDILLRARDVRHGAQLAIDALHLRDGIGDDSVANLRTQVTIDVASDDHEEHPQRDGRALTGEEDVERGTQQELVLLAHQGLGEEDAQILGELFVRVTNVIGLVVLDFVEDLLDEADDGIELEALGLVAAIEGIDEIFDALQHVEQKGWP